RVSSGGRHSRRSAVLGGSSLGGVLGRASRPPPSPSPRWVLPAPLPCTPELTSQLSSDQHPLDLGGPLTDLVDLHVTPVAGDRIFLDETVATVDLDRLVRGSLGGLGRVQLGHRGQALDLASRPPAVLVHHH